MIFKPGDTFENSFELTDDVYESFIRVFNDQNPLHTDDAYAQSKGFKGKVMNGNILNGFLSHFVGECLPVKNVVIHAQSIQYKSAVYLHDRLIFNAQVTGVYQSVNAVEFSFTYHNASSLTVAKGKFQIGILK